MILQCLCEIDRNVRVDNYTAVEGTNTLTLIDDRGDIVDSNVSSVLWCGKGSPFPTPPGGPWKADYIHDHGRFGECFYVHSDRESEIFVHFAQKKSYGCFIVNPYRSGIAFMEELIKHSDGLKVVQLPPIDIRSDEAKAANPIDYNSIGRIG